MNKINIIVTILLGFSFIGCDEDNPTPTSGEVTITSELLLEGSTYTFNGFVHQPMVRQRIDYIFTRNLPLVRSHGIIAEKWDDEFASDHYPVLVSLQLTTPKN